MFSFTAERKSRVKPAKRRQETAEEKKARKEAVKEERRAKRVNKKELRNVFKCEGTKMIRSTANEQTTDHVSVFRYT
jgi:protein LTV1